MEKEIWKAVEGFSDYEVSNLGNVRSFKLKKNGSLLKPRIFNKSYQHLGVKLMNDNHEECYVLVHRLVAVAFVPKREGMNVVNHIDGNKLNNVATNLEWTDHQGNNKHAYENGLRKSPSGKSREVARIENDETIEIYPSVRQASMSVGISDFAIRSVCLKKRKTAGGFQWKHIDV